MTKETKNKIKELHVALVKEYGKDFELALSSTALFFTTDFNGGGEDIDVTMPGGLDDT